MTLRKVLAIQLGIIALICLSDNPHRWFVVAVAIACGVFCIWWEWLDSASE